jgi:hypothetical protein
MTESLEMMSLCDYCERCYAGEHILKDGETVK